MPPEEQAQRPRKKEQTRAASGAQAPQEGAHQGCTLRGDQDRPQGSESPGRSRLTLREMQLKPRPCQCLCRVLKAGHAATTHPRAQELLTPVPVLEARPVPAAQAFPSGEQSGALATEAAGLLFSVSCWGRGQAGWRAGFGVTSCRGPQPGASSWVRPEGAPCYSHSHLRM